MKPSMTIYALHDAFDAGELDVPDAIEFAREIGMTGMELGYYWQDEERDCGLAKQWMADAGLEVTGYIVGTNFIAGDDAFRKEQIATVKHCIDRAKQLGAPFVRVFAGGRVDECFEEDRETVVDCLRACLTHAEATGVKIAMENHGGLGGNSEHLLYYTEALASDYFGYVLDIGNLMATGGEDSVEGSKRLVSGALLVHCKDGILDENGKWIPRLLGQGDVQVEECLKVIAGAGYDGYASIEYEVPLPWQEGIRHEAEYLCEVLGRIG